MNHTRGLCRGLFKVQYMEGEEPSIPCHSERSEESVGGGRRLGNSLLFPNSVLRRVILRFAQNDKGGLVIPPPTLLALNRPWGYCRVYSKPAVGQETMDDGRWTMEVRASSTVHRPSSRLTGFLQRHESQPL